MATPESKYPPIPGMHHVVSTFRILLAAHPRTVDRLSSALSPFGYNLDTATEGHEAQTAIQKGAWDLIISSTDLPQMDGFLLLRSIRTNRETVEIPYLMMVGSAESQDEIKAFQLGADEVVPEKTSDVGLRARVRVLLRLSTYRRRLQNEKRMLGIKVAERTRELVEITMATVAALEKATELSDPETGHHILRVATYSTLIADKVGLSSELVEKIRLYAPLHDLGKVAVADRILKKEGVLTPEEFEEMKLHTNHGHELLMAAQADEVACNIALSHHERIDGSGYPNALKGEAIPVEARIVAIADVFDAMTTVRRYKEAIPPDVAMRTITVELANRFDTGATAAFIQRFDEVMQVFESYS